MSRSLRSCSPLYKSQNALHPGVHTGVLVGGVRQVPVDMPPSLGSFIFFLFLLLFLLFHTFHNLQDIKS